MRSTKRSVIIFFAECQVPEKRKCQENSKKEQNKSLKIMLFQTPSLTLICI